MFERGWLCIVVYWRWCLGLTFVVSWAIGLGRAGSDSLILGAVASVVACMRGNRTKSSRRLDRDEAAGGGIICSGSGGCFVSQMNGRRSADSLYRREQSKRRFPRSRGRDERPLELPNAKGSQRGRWREEIIEVASEPECGGCARVFRRRRIRRGKRNKIE